MSPSNWMLYLAITYAAMFAMQEGNAEASQPHFFHEKSKKTFKNDKLNSLFGYSIAYQKEMDRLIVGAPADDKLGKIYMCPSNEETCDKKTYGPQQELQFKNVNSSYWFGAKVDAGETFFVACAPRYPGRKKTLKYTMTKGHCYFGEKNRLTKINEIGEPFLEEFHSKAYRQDLGQGTKPKTEHSFHSFGWSTHIYNKSIFVGSPPITTGRVYKYNTYNKDFSMVPVDNVKRLKEMNRLLSFNFGYSITSGYFTPTANYSFEQALAISTPYGTYGYGRVYFYNINGTEALDMWIEGSVTNKVGSLFGACLATLTLATNDKSQSALLVGAPTYVSNDSTVYDVGAVFIYRFFKSSSSKNPEPVLVKQLLPVEELSGGRFGSSIISIGDFDGDHIPEIAVAEPLANDGRGVVYVYSGKHLLDKNTGSKVNWIQKLLPDASTDNIPSYYGWSLTALADADRNGCNELAIGAPRISSVTMFHCIASVNVSFEMDSSDLTNKQAEEIANGLNTSFILRPCLKIEYGSIPDPTMIKTNVIYTLKIKHPSVTIDAKDNEYSKETSITGYNNTSPSNLICPEITIILPEDGNYDEKVKIEAYVSLNPENNPLEKTKFDPTLVLLNKNISYTNATTLHIPQLPGSNLTLKLHTNLKDRYTIGSTNEAQLNVTVKNYGNTAHGVCFQIPLKRIDVPQPPQDCYVKFNQNRELICNLSIIKRRVEKTISVNMSLKSLTSSDEQLKLSPKLFTSDCKIATGFKSITVIQLKADYNVAIKTYSYPSMDVSVTKEDLYSNGKNIEQKYMIINNGFTSWENLTCEIKLPTQVTVEKVTMGSKPCPVIDHKSNCLIKLQPKLPIDVKIQMKIDPRSSFTDEIQKGNGTLGTYLVLKDMFNSTKNITTMIYLWKAPRIPIWMLVVAALVGLILIVIMIWPLRKCGFLQRKNKDRLKKLKRDIHRQSMAKSMRLSYHSKNADSMNSTEDLLLDDSDFEVISDEKLEAIQKTLVKQRLSRQVEDNNDTLHYDVANRQANDILKSDYESREGKTVNAEKIREMAIDKKEPERVNLKVELPNALAKGLKPIYTKIGINEAAYCDGNNKASTSMKNLIFDKNPNQFAVNDELSKVIGKRNKTVSTQESKS